MSRRLLQLIISLLATAAGALSAQTDTLLPAVTVRDARFERTGYGQWRADSLPVLAVLNLADRLAWETPLEVRINAPGTLATLSARGMGPTHTPVYWMGLNLQSPMNGVVDAALLPLWPGDRLELRAGGQSAALSAGAMGGSVLLEPARAPVWGPDTRAVSGQVAASSGSFGAWSGQGALTFATPRLTTTARGAWQRADNDFPFRNTSLIGAPTVRQVQNFLEKTDVQHFTELKTGARGGSVQTAVWHQRAFRELPPTMTQSPVESWQRDRATRAVVQWRPRVGERRQWQHRAAWLDESIEFYLPGALEQSRSATALGGTDFTAVLGRAFVARAGGQLLHQTARADGYRDSTATFRQWRGAAYAMLEQSGPRVRWTALVRQEWAEGQGAPFTWSAAAEVPAGRAGAGRVHVSRNFNLPTFNDRYWRVYGNPGLRPETGYSADAGWTVRPAAGLTLNATLFHLLIDDWILWQPGADGLFRPGNVRRVWSRGVELGARYERQWSDGTSVQASAQYFRTRATTVAVYAGEAAALHRQLPFTAAHRGSFSVRARRGGLLLAYLHQWTGPRFTNADNSAALPAFHTGTALAGYGWTLRRGATLTADARLENVWNAAYQWLPFRPMPGRAWRVGVGVGF